MRRSHLFCGFLGLLSAACESGKVPEPEPNKAAAKPAATAAATASAQPTATKPAATTIVPPQPEGPKKVLAKPVAELKPVEGDPEQGKFTLDEALKGLPKDGPLLATIQTDQGALQCELFADKAPNTVANFVGLARGLRAWKKGDKWVKEPLYDGLVFHRIKKGFMLQGGDPNKDGSGGPGYTIPEEIWEDANFNKRGLMAMARRPIPNTGGSQFFIMDGPAPHLDGDYTIFGMCGPDELIEKLADTPKSPVSNERPLTPPKMLKVTISRGKGAKK
jgi:peptidyl-prolyl cis-trans isomerase A (cyclophilin A)